MNKSHDNVLLRGIFIVVGFEKSCDNDEKIILQSISTVTWFFKYITMNTGMNVLRC